MNQVRLALMVEKTPPMFQDMSIYLRHVRMSQDIKADEMRSENGSPIPLC
jgi:hypothetical protein